MDFCGDRLYVVQVRQKDRSARPVLARWASRVLPAGAESSAVAAALRKLLEEEGFTARAAVFGLPKGRGFLHHRMADEAEAERYARADYVTAEWTTYAGREVLGIASRADVTRLVEIAAQAGLEPLAVELRLMGCVTALGLSGQAASEGTPEAQEHGDVSTAAPASSSAEARLPAGTGQAATLGLIIGEAEVTVALVDRGAVLSGETRSRGPVAEKLDRWDSALAVTEQMARLVELAEPEAPAASARAIINAADEQAARSLSPRLGVPVVLVSPGSQADLVVEGGQLAEAADFAAGIGLALEGLAGRAGAEGQAGLNFLRARRPPPRRRVLRWRHAVIAGLAVIVALVALVGGLALNQRGKLAKLTETYDQLAERLPQWRLVQQRLRAVGPWLATAEGGTRVSDRRVYDAITKLFPSRDAYVFRASIEPGQGGQGPSIELRGRARQANVLHDFVSQLNGSPLFARASLGLVVDDPEDRNFPKRFSLTFSLRQGG